MRWKTRGQTALWDASLLRKSPACTLLRVDGPNRVSLVCALSVGAGYDADRGLYVLFHPLRTWDVSFFQLAFVTACRLETLLWNWLDAREQNVSSDQEQGPVSSSPEPALAANPEPTQVSSDPASALVSSTSGLSRASPSAEPAQVSTSPGPAVKVGAPESNLATLSPEPSLVSADSFLHILKVLVKFCQHVDKLNRWVLGTRIDLSHLPCESEKKGYL